MKYIGTKVIEANEMNRGDYNKFRGWNIPENEDPADEGYLVNYPDGYISWSPKLQFNDAYRPTNGMTFGLAIEAMKKGFKVARNGWNSKGVWIYLMSPLFLSADKVNERTKKCIGEGKNLDSQPYIVMWTAQEKWQPGWVASQEDMLSEDWRIIE
jgi:hypothetical protein